MQLPNEDVTDDDDAEQPDEERQLGLECFVPITSIDAYRGSIIDRFDGMNGAGFFRPTPPFF